MIPLLTAETCRQLAQARREGLTALDCSLDLHRSVTRVALESTHWVWAGGRFTYPERCKERTVYAWAEGRFQAVSRYGESLIKLVPTAWGAPTFEIDGIKMLPSAEVSPYADAEQKVNFIEPRGKTVLDCCGGLGYFADWCLRQGAVRVCSFEKNADVIWLRTLNPWSPAADARLTLTQADITLAIASIPTHSFDAILHDPPRFAIAGELYSEAFYRQLARVIRRRGKLFHYTGAPNKIARGRDLASEVIKRLQAVGFEAQRRGDGVMACRLATD
jgi:predicted methyltransferase